jgi:hypothetical protein
MPPASNRAAHITRAARTPDQRQESAPAFVDEM